MMPPSTFATAMIELLWVGALAAVAGFCWTVGCWAAGRFFGAARPH